MNNHKLEHKIKHLYKINRRTVDGYTYTVPSSDTYPYQWLWDSCFAAMTMSYFDIPQAKNELRALVSKQFESGMIPHMIYWQHEDIPEHLKIAWGKKQTSSITQPPLLAEAVLRIYEKSGDIEFVKEMLPAIHAFHKFFYRQRDPRKTGIIGIINPDESGEDTSPRFDSALELPEKQSFVENYGARMDLIHDWREARFVVKKRMDLKHWVRDVPFNVIFCESLHITARLAAIAGDHAIADWSSTHADQTGEAIKKQLVDESGTFLSTINYGTDEKKIDVRTWSLFAPLYAGLVSHDEAARLVGLLQEPDLFLTPYGIPTVSMDEPTFNLDAVWPWPNWRGPIWFAPHWMIAKGLRRYGYNSHADAIRDKSIALLEKSDFREFYNPFSGEGYGAKGFIWGGLVLDM